MIALLSGQPQRGLSGDHDGERGRRGVGRMAGVRNSRVPQGQPIAIAAFDPALGEFIPRVERRRLA